MPRELNQHRLYAKSPYCSGSTYFIVKIVIVAKATINGNAIALDVLFLEQRRRSERDRAVRYQSSMLLEL